ncbi:probable receptor-like protein kinase At1g80640 [Impatiens glandulifera]|uniref:probable receptor-like protein kinase At1g80640 n=1 Tax=Impatiens glandulifera TaxID=253017 RepID=UPI001FB07AFF|nr:probable receptor-like protein kinase At1g80640 [Impatiens glandulifera]
MNLLLTVFLLLLNEPIWNFHHQCSSITAVTATATPVPSPSMAAFSPGIENEEHRNRKDPHMKLVIALIITCTVLVGTILSLLLCLWIYQRRKSLLFKIHQKNSQTSDSLNGISLDSFVMGECNSMKLNCRKLMDYQLLQTRTNNFDEMNILGVGGFGCVYKADLGNNLLVAVKKLDSTGSPDAIREFETEVSLLSKMHHPNIISLLGYSIKGETRLIVYELMQNGSLDTQLHGQSRGSALSWNHRLKIALDIARGLEYLHEHCSPSVIHRDLKSSNILLDANFNAKLSDFGLALTDGTQNHVKLSGTLGYVAPEYLLDGKLTDKSDVYAFGVVLLELLLGKKAVEKVAPSQCQSIVTWAMPQLTDRIKLPVIVDPVIRDTMDLKHLFQVAAVAVLCVQPEPSYRPLITDVLHSLIPLVPVELGGTLRNTRLSISSR